MKYWNEAEKVLQDTPVVKEKVKEETIENMENDEVAPVQQDKASTKAKK